MSEIVEKNQDVVLTLPVIALRNIVCFPNMTMQFDIMRKKWQGSIDKAVEKDQMLFLVTQKNQSASEVEKIETFQVGCTAKILQVYRHSDEGIRLLVEGRDRAKIIRMNENFDTPVMDVSLLYTAKEPPVVRGTALVRKTKELLQEYNRAINQNSPGIIYTSMNETRCSVLADFVASQYPFDYEAKQEILEELNPYKRLSKLCDFMAQEIEIEKAQMEISRKIRSRIDINNRNFFLREQMRAINEELGGFEEDFEADNFLAKVTELELSEESKEKLVKDCKNLSRMQPGSNEYSSMCQYLEQVIGLPWSKYSKLNNNITKAASILDKDHYGLEKVKERVVESLAVQKLTGKTANNILCLVGPPGVGKTSIAKSIARATGRKYARIALGGVRDEAEILGHRKTYVSAMPGRIITSIEKAGTKNPLILLDEIDKLCQDYKGDPASALLEVLDGEQNSEFVDHYIEVPFDLSDCLFITTANDDSRIPTALRDRLEIIEIPSYTHNEKFHIASDYLIKKQFEKNGIKKSECKINNDALNMIIENYTKEAGVRNLERMIGNIARKCAKIICENDESTSSKKKVNITEKNIEEFLGPIRFKKDDKSNENEVGVVNGLAWTSVGGELLPIEVRAIKGKGEIQLTGNLGDVMKESAKTAISCVRTRAHKWKIDPDFYKKMDIHIHAPEGAVPKDGPSAGIAMTTAVLSALSGKAIRNDIAMTGEITLRGKVLPIGGLREKTMAALRNGITDVIIPDANVSDLAKIEEEVKKQLNFHAVKSIDEVIKIALVDN